MPKRIQIPTIEFRKSWVYDSMWKRPKRLQQPPSKKDWNTRERKLRQLWSKHVQPILRALSSVTGLTWREERIIVYLTWGVRPFSDPVTISLRSDVVSVFETLTHELIHRICSEEKNLAIIQRRWKNFVAKYPKEVPIAINHVPIHAVHEVVWHTLFPKRVEALKSDLKLKPYVRSWKIVDTIGADNIIQQVFRR